MGTTQVNMPEVKSRVSERAELAWKRKREYFEVQPATTSGLQTQAYQLRYAVCCQPV